MNPFAATRRCEALVSIRGAVQAVTRISLAPDNILEHGRVDGLQHGDDGLCSLGLVGICFLRRDIVAQGWLLQEGDDGGLGLLKNLVQSSGQDA